MYRRLLNFIKQLFSPKSTPAETDWFAWSQERDREMDEMLKDSAYWQKIRGEKESEYIDRLRALYATHEYWQKGGALLFKRKDALRFVDDLAEKGFVVLGVTCWYTVENMPGAGEDIEYQFGFGEEILFRDHPVKESAPEVKKFILELPEHITHVSFDLFIPMMWLWELFPEKWQAWEQNQAEK
ncbi:MAG: hypothetical protein K8L91_02995 [Anaerolineae bacterium]|nr:hypothetical protein [Anaerolineae bacterium]